MHFVIMRPKLSTDGVLIFRVSYQSKFVMIMVHDSLLFPFSFIRFEINVERKVVY